MDNNEKEKWRVRGAVLGIFLLGFVAGIFFLSVYHNWLSAKQPMDRQARFEQTVERLKLDEEQKAKVHDIFEYTRAQMQSIRRENAPRVKEVRRQTDERLQKVLNVEQWKQFQQIREESNRNAANK